MFKDSLVFTHVLRYNGLTYFITPKGKTMIQCDICNLGGEKVQAMYDARIPGQDVWANLCQTHFDIHFCELGLGKGQELKVEPSDDGQKACVICDNFLTSPTDTYCSDECAEYGENNIMEQAATGN